MSIFRFLWPPPLGWSRARRWSGSCWLGANYIWSEKDLPQSRPANDPDVINTLLTPVACLGQEQTAVNSGQNHILQVNNRWPYEICRLSRPAFAVFAVNEWRGFRGVLGKHFRAVPFQLLADAQGDAAEQDDLGQVGGDVKIGVTGLSAFAGGNPFKMMAFIAIAFVLVARDGLRNSFDGFVVSTVHQFLFVLEFEEESRAIVIRGE